MLSPVVRKIGAPALGPSIIADGQEIDAVRRQAPAEAPDGHAHGDPSTLGASVPARAVQVGDEAFLRDWMSRHKQFQ